MNCVISLFLYLSAIEERLYLISGCNEVGGYLLLMMNYDTARFSCYECVVLCMSALSSRPMQFEQIARLLKGLTAIKTSDEDRLISMSYQLYVMFQELRELSRVADKRCVCVSLFLYCYL